MSENQDSIGSQSQNEAQIEEKSNSSVVVKHITKQGNKELVGVIIVGSTLENMRTYDRYAFKKDEGIFVRLKHLANIPNEYLSLQQYQLKFQSDLSVLDAEPDELLEPIQPAAPIVTPPQLPSTSQPTLFDPPQQKTSSFKYIAIAFIVLLMVIFFLFSGKENIQEKCL